MDTARGTRMLRWPLAAAAGLGLVLAGFPWSGAAGGGGEAAALTSCQRIDGPGQYRLATDLAGAPIGLSVEASLNPSYAPGRSLTRACIEITASDVRLDCRGHGLEGTGDRSSAAAGIVIAGAPAAPLSDVRVENCGIAAHQFGLYAEHLTDGAITGNDVSRNAGTGIYLQAPSDVTVRGNTVVGNDPDGILVLEGNDVTVSGNVVFFNRMRGITFDFGCRDCAVRANESHSHGVLGFAIYAATGMTLEENVAHDNRYHGFAILHEAGDATFRNNEAFANDATGFFLQESRNNHFVGNVSHDNGLDGVAMSKGSSARLTTFEGNALHDNGGYGMLADTPIDAATTSDNTFSGNALGPIGTVARSVIDSCAYTGFGPLGPCDPVFEGGPNLTDPVALEPVLDGAHIVGDPNYHPSMGDLWMSTWDDDDRLFLTWGDGTGFAHGYPTTYPDHQDDGPVSVACKADPYRAGDPDYFPHGLWCNVFRSVADQPQPRAPLTDAGVAMATGPVPGFDHVENVAIDVPGDGPSFVTVDEPPGSLELLGTNDKPSSLLFADGRLYLAGHHPAGAPVEGYVAHSDDDGRTWTRVPGSPWGSTSNFRVLMFINRGQAHAYHRDGFVYALGIGAEASWPARTVHLARVPQPAVADYGAYEYFTGLVDGAPQWSTAQADAKALDGLHTIGQASAMYHVGTGRYLMLTAAAEDDPDHDGALFESPHPWGPWTRAADLCFDPVCQDPSDNPAWTDTKYIAGLIPKGAGPDHVYFTIAGGDDHYQLQIGRLELERR